MAEAVQHLKLIMTQEGAEQVGRAVGGVAKQQQGLTGFVREQRTEQRMQNFLFREGAMSALVLANAFGNTSEQSKRLTASLNSGFVTFQGLNFLLARLPNSIGIVLSAMGGLAAFLNNFSTSEEGGGKKFNDWLDSAIEKLVNLPGRMNEARDAVYRFQIEELQRERERLKIVKERFTVNPSGGFGAGAQNITFNRLPNEIDPTTGRKYDEAGVKRRTEEINGRVTELNSLLSGSVIETRNLAKEFEDADKASKKIGENIYNVLDLLRRERTAGDFTGPLGPNYFGDPFGMRGGVGTAQEVFKNFRPRGVQEPKFDPLEESQKIAEQKTKLMDDMFASSADVLRSEFGNAWEDIFGEANSLFEKMAASWAEILLNDVFGSLISLLPGGSVVGFIGSLFDSPGVTGSGASVERQLNNAPAYRYATQRHNDKLARYAV